MNTRLYHVDAFTSKAFAGNPAAICLLSEPRDDDWMQNVAREMNLSETAFLTQSNDGYGLRWFTPTMEVDLCGHATLASAHVLWNHEGQAGWRRASLPDTQRSIDGLQRRRLDRVELPGYRSDPK